MDQTALFFTRAASPDWQAKLRASVRLYLALGAQPAAAQQLEARLQQTEAELLDSLLAGPPPAPDARARAQQFLDTAQHRVLDSAQEVRALLASGDLLKGELAPVVGQGDFLDAGRQLGHEQHLAVGVPFLHGRAQVRGHGASHVHAPVVGGRVAVAQDGLHQRVAGLESGHAHALAGGGVGEGNLGESREHEKELVEVRWLNRQRWQAQA
ncbi:MAG: hypothetical protein ACRYF0_07645 [Janthinobacterium lividum]